MEDEDGRPKYKLGHVPPKSREQHKQVSNPLRRIMLTITLKPLFYTIFDYFSKARIFIDDFDTFRLLKTT